jgi:hypothetical protein
MSALWWIPLALGAVAPVLLYLGGRQVARELTALRASTAALRDLGPAVSEVRIVAERTRRAVQMKDLR